MLLIWTGGGGMEGARGRSNDNKYIFPPIENGGCLMSRLHLFLSIHIRCRLLLLLFLFPLSRQRRRRRKGRRRGRREDLVKGRGGGEGGPIIHPSCRLLTGDIVRLPILLLQGGRMAVGGSAIGNDKNDSPGLGENRRGEGGRGRT